MKVKRESDTTLSDPMNCSLLDSSVHGIFQARVLEWGASAFSEIKYRKEEKVISHQAKDIVQFPVFQQNPGD